VVHEPFLARFSRRRPPAKRALEARRTAPRTACATARTEGRENKSISRRGTAARPTTAWYGSDPSYQDLHRQLLTDDLGRVKLLTLRRQQAMNALDAA
jgi:hypothetical protein